MLTRRSFIRTATLAASCSILPRVNAAAQPSAEVQQSEAYALWLKSLDEAVGDNFTLGRIILPPDHQDVKDAQEILDNAPTGVPPIRVAEYFSTIPPKFQRAWPEPNPANPQPANPLVVEFFRRTRTPPSGDQLPWCAAFANWCLDRAGIVGTRSAASQSFATWGNPTLHPKEGDLVVFQRHDARHLGHVAFFKRFDGKAGVRVFGGNQITGGVHLIDERRFPIVGKTLSVIAYRTLEGLPA